MPARHTFRAAGTARDGGFFDHKQSRPVTKYAAVFHCDFPSTTELYEDIATCDQGVTTVSMMTKLHTQRREEQAIDRGIFRARGTRLIRAQVGSTRGISAALALTFVTAIAAPIVEAGTISASRTQIVEAGGITTVSITPLISVDG